MTVRFKDEAFQRGLQTALASCHRRAADTDEVLATARRIKDGDSDSWLDEWVATAGAVWSAARHADHEGLRAPALARYVRAATYYALALQRVFHSSEPERQPDIWQRQRDCWERVVDLSPVPGQRLAIPYETSTLPGFFFPAPDAQPGERRPLVVINNGLIAPTSQSWELGAVAASEYGHHWMTFDGPGQQAVLHEQAIVCRPDWEAVLTPVLDAALRRPDVDPERIAIIGNDEGGYLVARALCFEHRFTVAATNPGIVDLASSWTRRLPGPLLQQLIVEDAQAFDREMHLAELFSRALSATVRHEGLPFGLEHRSRFQLFKTTSTYRLGEETDRISTPLLVIELDDEHRWPGQARLFYDRLPAAYASIQRAPSPNTAPILDWMEGYLRRGRGLR